MGSNFFSLKKFQKEKKFPINRLKIVTLKEMWAEKLAHAEKSEFKSIQLQPTRIYIFLLREA